jgi:ABC-type antimicrobial peptide transport system permease subunit
MAHSPWRLAGRTLRRHPGRTTVMAIALVIGVASITLTVAAGEGARRAVEQSFKAMVGALDVLFVQPGGAAQRGMANVETSIATLTRDDAGAIARSVPNVRAVGAQQSEIGAVIEANGKDGTTALFGATANWASLRGDSVTAGAFYSEADGQALARVAVLGADVAREFFPDGNAVGQHVRVHDVDFEVVGVLAPNGAGPGGISMDNLVYVPLETTQRRVFNREPVSLVSIKLADEGRWAETQAAVHALLRARHGKAGNDLDDFRVSSPEAMIARAANVDTTLRKALLWVSVLALAIGGVIIANLMFAATVSRRREIGTRRAVGASRGAILIQFWAESILVASGAAVCGAGAAIAVTALGARVMRMQLAVSWPVTLGAISATIAIGVLAGYFPARRAAAVPPGVALRDEG